MTLGDLFENIKNSLKGHDGTPEGRLKYYEEQILQGNTGKLNSDEKREYLEAKGIGSIAPKDLNLEEVTKSKMNHRSSIDGSLVHYPSLLFKWTTSSYLRHLPENLEKVPKEFFTEEALLEKQPMSHDTVLTNLYKFNKEHLVPDELKTEEFLTLSKDPLFKPTLKESILYGLIEVAGIRAIPEGLRTEEFLMKDRKGGNYFTEVISAGDIDKLPKNLITLDNLLNNKKDDYDMLSIAGKYCQLNSLPKDIYSKENLEKYKYQFVDALCLTCYSQYVKRGQEPIPKELLNKDFLTTRIGPNHTNTIEIAAGNNSLHLLPPKIVAEHLMDSLKNKGRGQKNIIDIISKYGGLSPDNLNGKDLKNIFKYMDKESLSTIQKNYPAVGDILKEMSKEALAKRGVNQELAIA